MGDISFSAVMVFVKVHNRSMVVAVVVIMDRHLADQKVQERRSSILIVMVNIVVVVVILDASSCRLANRQPDESNKQRRPPGVSCSSNTRQDPASEKVMGGSINLGASRRAGLLSNNCNV